MHSMSAASLSKYPQVASARSGASNVTLCTVSTYVREPKPGNVEYASVVPLLPKFASHWGIVVETESENEDAWLFHLQLRISERERQVELCVEGFERNTPRLAGKCIRQVGHTRYSIPQIARIGREMIKAFGDYHLVFWNCQMFAKCLLKVITEERDASFDLWTSADTTNLFLCSIIILAPLGTVLKSTEIMKMKDVIKAGKLKAERYQELADPDPQNREELNEYSDSAIDLIRDASIAEADLEVVKDSEDKIGVMKTVVGLLKGLFGRNVL